MQDSQNKSKHDVLKPGDVSLSQVINKRGGLKDYCWCVLSDGCFQKHAYFENTAEVGSFTEQSRL